MSASKDICEKFVKVTFWFPKNTPSKNAFLSVYLYVDKTIDLYEIISRALFAGNIGAGDSLLHNYWKFSKTLRMRAIFHDDYGYMRSVNNVGPGYDYKLTTEKKFKNSMLLGHFSGILFWTFMKILKPESFDNFPF